MDKITRVLLLFYRLSRGEKINKSNCCIEFKITGRTFDRDIEDIRLFLSELYTSSELVFDRTNNCYSITNLYDR